MFFAHCNVNDNAKNTNSFIELHLSRAKMKLRVNISGTYFINLTATDLVIISNISKKINLM